MHISTATTAAAHIPVWTLRGTVAVAPLPAPLTPDRAVGLLPEAGSLAKVFPIPVPVPVPVGLGVESPVSVPNTVDWSGGV